MFSQAAEIHLQRLPQGAFQMRRLGQAQGRTPVSLHYKYIVRVKELTVEKAVAGCGGEGLGDRRDDAGLVYL